MTTELKDLMAAAKDAFGHGAGDMSAEDIIDEANKILRRDNEERERAHPGYPGPGYEDSLIALRDLAESYLADAEAQS